MKNPLLVSAIMALLLSLFSCDLWAYTPDLPDIPVDGEVLYGDSNNDGMVNILDLITVVNYIMGLNPDPFDFEAADVNNDGVIDVLDLIFESNVIMEIPGIPCPGEPTVTYEGQTYNTVDIADQCWLRENLNVGTKVNSTEGGYQQTNNGIVEKYCYGNDDANCIIYGGLYEWTEAMQYIFTEGGKGICPMGWHIPTDNEWKVLEGSVDSQYPVGDSQWDLEGWRGLDAGGNLKTTGTVEGDDGLWITPNTGATNSSGFTCVPGAYRNGLWGYFDLLGRYGRLWSSSQYDVNNAWYRSVYYTTAAVLRDGHGKEHGFAVHCLRNNCTAAQAYAGEDTTICEGQTILIADATASDFTNLYWITSGTGTFNDPALLHPTYTPSLNDIAGQEVVLTLAATGIEGCPDAESGMVLAITGAPMVNAGADAGICSDQHSYVLSGNATSYASALWSTSGTGEFNDPGSLSATYTSSAADVTAGQVTLTLTVYGNAPCGQVSDDMDLSIWAMPLQANAGPDQLGITGISTSLEGNAPTVGTGLWEIVAGEGGIVMNPTSPTSGFQGNAGNEYTLSWAITSICGSTMDQVVISFAESFSCGDDLLYDGQSYASILIGTQCWMAGNLNIGTMINSNSGGQLQTDNGIIEKYCYNNDPANCTTYGGLYEWNEAMQYMTSEGAQGICPEGWHIPTNAELKVLEGTVDSQYPVGDPEWDNAGYRGYDAGGNLKEAGTAHWITPNTGATNSSGFTGLPGGQRNSGNGSFVNFGYLGNFWSSSKYDAVSAYCRSLRYMNANIRLGINLLNDGYSIRCLKD